MKTKILAFDMDGTLLRSDRTLDPASIEAVRKAMDAGLHIVIASGRDRSGCQPFVDALGLAEGENFLALVNGQILYDIKNKEYDLDDVLSPEDGLKIQAVCAKYDVEGIFCCGYDFYSYLSRMGRIKKGIRTMLKGEPADYGLKTGHEERNFLQLNLKPFIFSQDINKVCLAHSRKFFQENIDSLRTDLKDYDLLLVGPEWLEIMPKGVSKASALKRIAEKLGMSMENVMAFGDAENDLQMLKEAGIGVAMGNGMEATKKAANVTTDTNDQGGIAKAIHALLDGQEEALRNGTWQCP